MCASSFNVMIVQTYAPTIDSSDYLVEEYYTQLQETVDTVNRRDILIVQGDINAKVGLDTMKEWAKIYGPACNSATNDRGLLLLEFAGYNQLILVNTLGQHKQSRWWTWHSPNCIHILKLIT